jgi:hypothetical protein
MELIETNAQIEAFERTFERGWKFGHIIYYRKKCVTFSSFFMQVLFIVQFFYKWYKIEIRIMKTRYENWLLRHLWKLPYWGPIW